MKTDDKVVYSLFTFNVWVCLACQFTVSDEEYKYRQQDYTCPRCHCFKLSEFRFRPTKPTTAQVRG